ncbi:DUF4222 domain-containing protein [Morganella morganii]|uniref:DUF4222 domain-containing protein n=1 Tax=Morganella morganii TaxID=582 RepID=UPI00076B8583|nr:DUF4222 domain-containing protein [Morganella morganii]AMG70504.1 DUF4222 domain-containing protein [Morganella morganii]ATF53143.1 DUF4222 domain-containing protein [Morganella morganii]EKW8500607.1 DUF4222 domain-containing protein [Morganella morganii]MBT0452845.1 DUF4222 domain-containing protein [Morganella morganii subsp. morganii]MBT0486434.1 DUF4222 domain-containing protein [Morganella morganii subsp. morganii]
MPEETADNLNRYYTDKRGRKVHVIRYDRENSRVIFMRDGYEHQCFEPLKIFQELYARCPDEVKP